MGNSTGLFWRVTAVLALAAPGGPANALATPQTALILTQGVAAGLDVDGPSIGLQPSYEAMLNLMEPLVRYRTGAPTDNGALQFDFTDFAPALAESWSYDAASFTWTFKLRHGVRSCAGNELTADDVAYTFARAKSRSGQVPIGFFLASVAAVKNFTKDLYANTPEAIAKRTLGDEVTKLDRYTVQIKQSGANPLLLHNLQITALLIYDSVEMKKHATPADPWSHAYSNRENAPSFGAYCLESWKREQAFVVKANPSYYGGQPYFTRVIVRKVPQDSNRIAILRSGEAQAVEGLNPQELSSLKHTAGVAVQGGYLNTTLMLLPNWKNKPFDDVRVRQALAYAIPYAEIVKIGYYGDAKQWRGVVPSVFPGYHLPDTSYAYDPAKAKALLAAAGYPDGHGLEKFPDSFKLTYVAERESTVGPAATIIQTRLNDIGFPILLDPIPAAQFAQRQSIKRDMPLSLSDESRSFSVHALSAMQLYFLTPPMGVVNANNYSNPEVDKLFTTALTDGDEADRLAVLARMQDIEMRDAALIPIAEYKQEYGVLAGVKGVFVHPAGMLMWRTLYR
jgi:peptide/nickel transport system substrate-binding protein